MRVIVLVLLLIFEYQISLSQSLAAMNPNQDVPLEDLLEITISTASKYEQKVSEAPASVSIITRDDIQLNGYRTLAEVLQNETGMYISDDRNYSFIGTRGFLLPGSYNNKILLLLDGHTMNENIYGGTYYDNEYALDLNNIERIEIVRGPGSAVYGANALFAVINIITRTAKQINGIKVSGNFGAYGQKSGGISFGKEFSDNIAVAFSGKIGNSKGRDYYFKEYYSPETNNGRSIGNDASDFYGMNLKVNFYGLELNGFLSNHTKHTPTGKYFTHFNSNKFVETDRRAFAEIKYDRSIDNSVAIKSRAYFDLYDYEGNFPYLNEADNSEYIDKDKNIGRLIGIELQGTWDIESYLRILLGIQIEENFQVDYDKYTGLDNKWEKFSAANTMGAIYCNIEWDVLPEFSIVGGLRHDNNSENKNSFNPRIGLIYHPFASTTIKGLYGKAFRLPNIYETQYYDKGEQLANPYLQPERISTYELVLEQNVTSAFVFNLSAFYYRINDLINKQIYSGDEKMFQNIPNLDAKGLETRLSYKPQSGSNSIFINYSYTNCNGDDYYISHPHNKLTLGINQKIVENMICGANITYEDGRITHNKSHTDEFVVADVFIAFTLELNSLLPMERIRFNLNVNNIFDTEYYHAVGNENEQDRIIRPGRNANFSFYLEI